MRFGHNTSENDHVFQGISATLVAKINEVTLLMRERYETIEGADDVTWTPCAMSEMRNALKPPSSAVKYVRK